MRVHRPAFIFALLIAAASALPASGQQPPPPPARTKPVKPPVPKPPNVGGVKPTLLEEYGDWGAYTASPNGKKVCFAIAKPTSSETKPANRPRNPAYMFISDRPADKVTNEIFIIIGYPFRSNSEAKAEIGSTTFGLYTQGDGAWVRNASEEAHMIELMRSADTMLVKGMSSRGTQSSDTYSLKGLSEALDRTAKECQ